MALPSGYKLLEYIQSTGTQRVDTGIKPNSTTKVICEFKANSVASGGSFPFGCWRSQTLDAVDVAVTKTQVFYNYGTTYQFANYENVYERMVVTADRNRAEFRGSKTVTISLSQSTFSGTHNLYLFTANNNGSPYVGDNAWSGNMYYCQIYDNGTIVRDYIPCKNAGGTVGLWDDANGVFYGNAGSGAFIAGPELYVDTPTGFSQVPGVTLRWSPVSCEGYRIYRDGTLIGTTGETVYTDTTAELNQTYVYTLTAYRANLESAPAALTVYTKAGYFYYAPYFTDATF